MIIYCLQKNRGAANNLPRFSITYFSKMTEKMLVSQNDKGIFSSQIHKLSSLFKNKVLESKQISRVTSKTMEVSAGVPQCVSLNY